MLIELPTIAGLFKRIIRVFLDELNVVLFAVQIGVNLKVVTGLPRFGVPKHDLLGVFQALLLLIRDCQDPVFLAEEHLVIFVASLKYNRVHYFQFVGGAVYLVLAEFGDFIFIQQKILLALLPYLCFPVLDTCGILNNQQVPPFPLRFLFLLLIAVQIPEIIVDIEDLEVQRVLRDNEQVLVVGGHLCRVDGLPLSFPLGKWFFLANFSGFECPRFSEIFFPRLSAFILLSTILIFLERLRNPIIFEDFFLMTLY